VRCLSALKRMRNKRLPEIRLVVTVTNLTHDKITDFVDLAHDLGSDVRIELSGLIVEGELSGGLELSPEQKTAYADHVRRALQRARELGVQNNLELYCKTDIVHDGMAMHRDYVHQMSGGLVPSMCYEPWTSLSMLPDGSVGPCCAAGDPAALSLKHLSLAEVWYGAYMNKVREGMLNGHPPSYCQRCPSNLFAGKESRRRAFSPRLRQQLELSSRGVPGQVWLPILRYLGAKGVTSLREVGMRTTIERGASWLWGRRALKIPKSASQEQGR
jgi:MoaA/NifB/PqqE/SkfB family radical SAM enzyme